MIVQSSITPCVFGTTNGFEIQTLTKVPLNMDSLIFGVTRSEVELSDRDECVKVFRMRTKSEVYTWIGIYRKTYEIGFSREGGYYGAGLLLAGITVNARIALEVLRDLADQVSQFAISDGRFQCLLSSITDEMRVPTGLGPLKESSARHLRGGLSAEATPIAYVRQYGSPRETVDWAQTAMLGEKFRAVIIGPEAGFPKAASSRIEYYPDLNDVFRKLQDDVALTIDRLHEDKLALQKQVVALQAELGNEQNKCRDLQARMIHFKRQAERSLQQFGGGEQKEVWGLVEWPLILASIIFLIFGIGIGAGAATISFFSFSDNNESSRSVFMGSDSQSESRVDWRRNWSGE